MRCDDLWSGKQYPFGRLYTCCVTLGLLFNSVDLCSFVFESLKFFSFYSMILAKHRGPNIGSSFPPLEIIANTLMDATLPCSSVESSSCP